MQVHQLSLFEDEGTEAMKSNEVQETAKFLNDFAVAMMGDQSEPELPTLLVSAALVAAQAVLMNEARMLDGMAAIMSNAIAQGKLDESAAIRALTEWRDRRQLKTVQA